MPSPTSGSTFSLFSPTGNSNLDALLSGSRWGPTTLNTSLTISYSFPTATSTWSQSEYPAGSEPSNGFLALTSAQQTQVRKIFTMISSYTNLKFSEVTETATSVGDIRLGFTDMPTNSDGTETLAYAYMPAGQYSLSTLQGNSLASSGDVWLNSSTYAEFSSASGSDDNHTLIHEIGHALGLKHPFEEIGGFNAIDPNYESYDYTAMSYSAVAGKEYSTVSYAPTTLMAFDVYALQHLYGKNTTYNASNTTYTFYANQNYHQTLWDAGGTDTIVYESTSGGTINLQAGSWQAVGKPLIYKDNAGTALGQSAETVQILSGVTIENATGGEGADTVTGNAVANTLLGRGGNDKLNGLAGNDTLNGGVGADTLTGGDGSDSYFVDNVGDVVVETNATASTGGTDTVYSYLAAYTLGANVENGRILATGTANLTGNGLNNVLYAGAGSNVIDGGAGTDTVSYHYATAGVTVSLATTAAQATGGSGSDTLKNIENVIGSSYADSLTGSIGNNTLNGGSGNDLLNGGAGNDILIGGLGADKLTGGTGADRFDFNALSELGLSSTTWDTIVDFKTSEADKIDLLGVDANTALAGDQAFSFLGMLSAFTSDATSKLRFDATAHILYGSTDADTAAEFAIALTGVTSLTTANFVL